jgi:acetylglutamate kinase
MAVVVALELHQMVAVQVKKTLVKALRELQTKAVVVVVLDEPRTQAEMAVQV